MSATPHRIAVILAAGKGTRMRSAVAKPLHAVGGQPMLGWVLDAARAAGCDRLLIVVSPEADALRRRFTAPDVEWVVQDEQNGTGDAAARAEEPLAPLLESGEATLLVLSGDVPLVRPETLRRLLEAAEREGSWGAVAVADLAVPGALGRVIGSGGHLQRIVEARDATPEERAITTINAGLYALPARDLFDRLRRLTPDNAQGELYLTDAVTSAAADGENVALVHLADPSEAWGVNDRRDLAQVHRRCCARHLDTLMASGVTVLEPERTTVEATVTVGRDTVLHPGVNLQGTTHVGEGCTLHQGAWVRDTVIADGVTVEPYCVLDGAQVGDHGKVGPFARLRPGTVLDPEVKVGNFVEIKQARLHRGAKAGHLTYLGDAEIGPNTNIGAGVVTCNYDGERKHRTEVGSGAFIGSDTMLVAPVKVGDRATTAAGSVITKDVPDDALAVARKRQTVIDNWTERKARRREREDG
jgi:bifunctional UDP-N-acetylglucosamine pyrophosphorylase/glucosamine-1-phosphate N-acetyltransferase